MTQTEGQDWIHGQAVGKMRLFICISRVLESYLQGTRERSSLEWSSVVAACIRKNIIKFWCSVPSERFVLAGRSTNHLGGLV